MANFNLLIAIIYILSPIDLLPEAALGPIGLVDDGAAFLYIIKNLCMRIAFNEIKKILVSFLIKVLKFIFKFIIFIGIISGIAFAVWYLFFRG